MPKMFSFASTTRVVKAFLQNALNTFGWQALRRQGKGYDICRKIGLGRNHIKDIQTILGNRVQIIFDVGANDGQTVRTFLPAFSCAAIYSFEPDPQTFERLAASVKDEPRVRAVNAALGRETGNATLFRFKFDQTNSLLPKAEGAAQYLFDAEYMVNAGTVAVQITSIDEFCDKNGVEHVDLLKIDTQGYEVEVLEGARRLLNSGSVSMIYAEVCFVRYYERQPLFQDVYELLYDLGYRLIGIYESGFLTHSYLVGGNALFIHERLGGLAPAKPKIILGSLRICW
jgi:FkbM family methyltransferase